MSKRIIRSWSDVPAVVDTQLAADIANECVQTIRRKCHSGEIKVTKMGRKWKIPKEALMEYCSAHGTAWAN